MAKAGNKSFAAYRGAELRSHEWTGGAAAYPPARVVPPDGAAPRPLSAGNSAPRYGNKMKFNKNTIIYLALISSLFTIYSAPLHAEEKPEYEVSYQPAEKLITLAIEKIKEKGLDNKYDIKRPFYLQTASQMGDEYVGFSLPDITISEDSYVQLYCIVEVNSIFGRVGSIEELPNSEGGYYYAHLDETGKVTGYKIEKP